MTNTIHVRESLAFGWRTFKARPWFFVGTFVIYAVIQIILSMIQKAMPGFISFIISMGVSTLVYAGLIGIYLKAHDNPQTPTFKDFWNPKPFWKYLGTSILLAIIVIIGCILLIVPGVIAALALGMSCYLVVDKGMNPIAALKESLRITRGHRVKLFLFALAVLGLSILGALPLFLGLLVVAPVSMIAGIHIYRTLEGAAGAAPAPAIASPEAV